MWQCGACGGRWTIRFPINSSTRFAGWAMSSKSDELKMAPALGATWSISARLTVLYTLCAFGILFLALAFMYWEISDDLHNQEDQSLVDEITILRAIISEHPNDAQALRVEVELES